MRSVCPRVSAASLCVKLARDGRVPVSDVDAPTGVARNETMTLTMTSNPVIK